MKVEYNKIIFFNQTIFVVPVLKLYLWSIEYNNLRRTFYPHVLSALSYRCKTQKLVFYDILLFKPPSCDPQSGA